MARHASLAHLPTELYEYILDQVEPEDLQETTLALRRALLHSPVPVHQLFKHVKLTSRGQIPKLWQRLETSQIQDGDRPVTHWVQSFNLDTFDSDADVLYK